MRYLLYIVALTLIVLWILGYFRYHAGPLIHFLLIAAIVIVIARILTGSRMN